jgi:3-dehydroquinate synthase
MNDEIITVSLGDRSYDIFFGMGLYPQFQEWVARFFRGDPAFVVTDTTVASIYGDDIRKWLSGIPHEVLSLSPGEEGKNWDTAREIYSFLARHGAGRNSLIVAFGGGVVGDLAGFAAATFLRGMPFVQVPTTLLSQVDSSVGGKTGFNLPEGKNLVGAYHQPRAVFIDPGFLLTLSDRNLRAGMAEVVKCAFAGVPSLLERIAARGGTWKEMSGETWIQVIRSAVAFKARIVEQDEKEASTRRILNLGHTIGHALEQASGYGRLLHGEAVAMGLAWEAIFSRRQGVTPPGVAGSLIDLLLVMGFSLEDPSLPLPAIAGAIGMDKKRMVSEIEMPLLTGPGSCDLMRIPVSLLREDLQAVREEIQGILRDRAEATEAVDASPVKEEELRSPTIDQIDEWGSISALERRVVMDPRDPEAMVALSEAYRRTGNLAGAWETIKEALQLNPSSYDAQRLARNIEREMKESASEGGESSPLLEDVVILEEGAFELRPVDGQPVPSDDRIGSAGTEPGAPRSEADASSVDSSLPEEKMPIKTVTMASIYWEQGRQEEARRIIGEILRNNPGDARALAWWKEREEMQKAERGKRVISALTAFLVKIRREFGNDVPRNH